MQKFKVNVDDNYHFMDQDERYHAGTFETLEAAIAKCKDIVESELQDMHEPGMTADELYKKYCTFGEDPWIEGGEFSAWTIARQRSTEICKQVPRGD